MKPKDHPDFYRLAPPPGASRESTIRLDAEGHFWHDEQPVTHPALEQALHTWIARHPDDGRFILTNGYDWTYFQVDDAPYHVRSLGLEPDQVLMRLSDDTTEPLDPEALRIGANDALYAKIKAGRFEARFSRHAQSQLAPLLTEAPGGGVSLRVRDRDYRLG
jgi:hypothetical protein